MIVNTHGCLTHSCLTHSAALTPNLWVDAFFFFFFLKHLDAFSSLGLAHPRRRGREQQKMKWLDNITDAMDINVGQIWEIVKDREVWHATVYGAVKSQTQVSD